MNASRQFIVLVAIFIALGLGLVAVQKTGESHDNKLRREVDVQQVEAQRRGCLRTNSGLRDPLFDALTAAMKKAREEANDAPTESERQSAAVAEASYAEQRQNMIDSAADAPEYPGAATIDCNEAYPLPDE